MTNRAFLLVLLLLVALAAGMGSGRPVVVQWSAIGQLVVCLGLFAQCWREAARADRREDLIRRARA